MPAKSQKQRRFFGLVRAVQKGEVSPSEVSPEVVRAAETMKVSDVREFAKTKEKGLPEYVPKKKRNKTEVSREVL